MVTRILKAMVGNDTDGMMYAVDVIEYDGKIWLVPHWYEVPAKKVSMPARMVRIDNQKHQHVPGSPFGDYVLNGPIPKVLLEKTTPKQQVVGWEYMELPELEIPDTVRPFGNRMN